MYSSTYRLRPLASLYRSEYNERMKANFLEKYTIRFEPKKGPTLGELVLKRMSGKKYKGKKVHISDRVDEILYGK